MFKVYATNQTPDGSPTHPFGGNPFITGPGRGPVGAGFIQGSGMRDRPLESVGDHVTIVPFVVGADNSVVRMEVFRVEKCGESPYDADETQYLATFAASFDCTACGVTGRDGFRVEDEERFCDTITHVDGDTEWETSSNEDDMVAVIRMPLRSAKALYVRFVKPESGTPPTSANALYARGWMV